ncbi:MAG: hypothetical protein WBF89_12620 [Steroidobacteraceae bacterium]
MLTEALMERMAKAKKTPGEIYDEMLANPRRLAIAHFCLGLIATSAYWIRPGTVTVPVRWSVPHFADVVPIVATSMAWLPYLISMIVCRSLLSSRDRKATLLFVVLATIITALYVAILLNLVGPRKGLSPTLVSLLLTLALVVTSGVCSLLWPDDASKE